MYRACDAHLAKWLVQCSLHFSKELLLQRRPKLVGAVEEARVQQDASAGCIALQGVVHACSVGLAGGGGLQEGAQFLLELNAWLVM